MQTPEDFVKTAIYPERAFIAAITARDAEWQARDAEIRRECAERAVKCLCHFEHEWVERNGEMFPRHEDLLRAAIIGEEEKNQEHFKCGRKVARRLDWARFKERYMGGEG